MSGPRDVVEVVCRALVDDPDAITAVERDHAGSIRVELRSAPGDLGKLIGRQGRTAAAVRTLAQMAPKSWTPAKNIVPTMTQRSAGSQPQIMAMPGPIIGAAPATAVGVAAQ